MATTIKDLVFTADDLRRLQLQDIAGPLAVEKRDVLALQVLLRQSGAQYRAAGDAGLADAADALSAVCSFMFNLDDAKEPFSPVLVTPAGRSPVPDDFTDAQVQAIADVSIEIEDCELRARLCDFVWVRRRSYPHAMAAIQAYLDAARRFPADILNYPDRLERGLTLVVTLKKRDEAALYVSEIDQRLAHDGDEDGGFTYRLVNLLLRTYPVEPTKYAAIARTHAVASVAAGDLMRAERWWQMVSAWLAKAKDSTGARAATLERAECVVQYAATRPALAQAALIGQAIEILRTIPGTDARVAALHASMLSAQSASIHEMSLIETEPFDLTPLAKGAEEKVAGRRLPEALQTLALSVKPPSRATLEARAEARARAFPLQHLVSRMQLSGSGKRVPEQKIDITRPGGLEREALEALAHTYAQELHAISSFAFIEPMRERILLEHRPRLHDLVALVDGRPFVPDGRQLIVATGLYRGLMGDFLEAGHILIPQIENGIRTILSRHGVITNTLDTNLGQSEMSINALLEHERAVEIFGCADLIFNLRGFLCEKAGANLRHEVAHGLLDDEQMARPIFIYAWWLALHLVHKYHFIAATPSQAAPPEPDSSSSGETQ